VILAHSPKAEEDFMAAGNGRAAKRSRQRFHHRRAEDDPAGIADAETAAAAMALIAEAEAPFISRGDDSGTNTKELSLWTAAEIDPVGQSWYTETGSGWRDAERRLGKQGYTLTDRAFLAQQDTLDLVLVVEATRRCSTTTT
jgi:tungstate transport system substrate-binding protein